MMRRVTEAELAREPARELSGARPASAASIAAEVLLAFARERFDDAACRTLERDFWRAWAARRAGA